MVETTDAWTEVNQKSGIGRGYFLDLERQKKIVLFLYYVGLWRSFSHQLMVPSNVRVRPPEARWRNPEVGRWWTRRYNVA